MSKLVFMVLLLVASLPTFAMETVTTSIKCTQTQNTSETSYEVALVETGWIFKALNVYLVEKNINTNSAKLVVNTPVILERSDFRSKMYSSRSGVLLNFVQKEDAPDQWVAYFDIRGTRFKADFDSCLENDVLEFER